MSYRIDAREADVSERLITVAVMEPDDETRQHMLMLAAETGRLSVQACRDAASYNRIYGTVRHPDVLLVGLDTNPHEALTIIKRIAALTPACRLIVFGQP